MPKRKRDHEDYDYLSRKLRKLERKLRRARGDRKSSNVPTSVSSRDSTPSPHTHADDSPPPPPVSASPSDDVILCDMPPPSENTVLSAQQPVATITQACDVQQSVSSDILQKSNDDTTEIPEQVLDSELLEILGEDPIDKSEYGEEIHKELASRLEHIATKGLNKDIRKELLEKYLVPRNCTYIAAPQLNPEIKAALPDLTLKRDKGIEARQKQLSSAITCIGRVITSQMLSKDKNNELLKQLMDAIRIMCDVQHADSAKRRYFAFSSLKKDINDQLIHSKIDKFLFGENLAETLRAAKAVTKSGAELKVVTNNSTKTSNKPTQPQPSTSRNLNWKAPPPARRQQQGTWTQRNRQPAPGRKPEPSFKQSRHPSKPTRRQ
ncbi:uncharacterized protein LOC126375798 [Pectinophora gossypiella]|uniref:uncharacterized protein LOC126375798 n=1 Tax=Pectinophora gossypiella TaxID=13191 RepID=UPI00214E1F34|nr:uncharacterized protein LOC126375798 [Pectinophora gossypiella]